MIRIFLISGKYSENTETDQHKIYTWQNGCCYELNCYSMKSIADFTRIMVKNGPKMRFYELTKNYIYFEILKTLSTYKTEKFKSGR